MAGFVCEERLTYGPWAAIERMIARLILHAGFRDVHIVGGSGDNGADVVGTFRGERWLFQSKYRTYGGVDSNAAREVVRALSSYEADVAVAVSNSYFTEDAYTYLEQVERDGIKLKLWNGAYLLNYFRQLADISKNHRVLRDYQGEAVDCVELDRSKGRQQALVIMATGLGKSTVANQLIVNELQRNPEQEVLVLAHMTDLVRQLEQSCWPQLEKKYSTHLWTDGEVPSYRGGVVFATWQSILGALERGKVSPRQFGLVLVDEAHHAPSQVYQSLLADLQPNFLVGMTATPWRGDELRLEDIFGEPAFTMDIVKGMQRGYLADVDYRMLIDGIDWDEIARMSRQGLTVKDLNQLLLMPDRDVAMVKLISEKMAGIEKPRAIAFCRSIAHAERLQPLFAASGVRAALLHSKLTREERFKNLSSFRKGVIDLLISIEMLNEGIDVPEVNLVAFMRVTHSRRIFIQQLGRGLRVSPDKDKVLVLDFVADIRRVAAAIAMNRNAAARVGEPEVIRYRDGEIIQFDNDKTATFFDQYLSDVADIENLDEGSRLKFPDPEAFE